MTVAAPIELRGVRIGVRAPTAVGLAALMAVALGLRLDGLGAHLWMDEGIAVGIAGHPLTHIPGLLRLDGSPPLYYLLLHVWMAAVGSSDAAVHWLALVFAVLSVPAAWWAGVGLGGRRTAWILAALVACCPYVTAHAQEARMYTLVVLLGLLCLGCFARAFVQRRAGYRVPFGLALALLLYTHNWALFLAVALLAAALVLAPRDALVGFGVAGLLYLPWLPTLLFQARHTAAPWDLAPPATALVQAPEAVVGGGWALLVCALAGVAAIAHDRRAVALAAGAVLPLLIAWGLSQLSPAWDDRYLAVIVPPLLALTALGLRGPAGLAGLAVLLAFGALADPPRQHSGAYELARSAGPVLRRGDLVVVLPFGQVPLLAHYLPGGLRYASPLGPDPDPHVVDWRDVTRRMARPRPLAPAPAGSRVLLVEPAEWDARSGQTRLGREERRAARAYEAALLHDPRLRRIATLPVAPPALPRTAVLRGVLFQTVG